jgi:hypothetical protein
MEVLILGGIFYEMAGQIWVESHSEHKSLLEKLKPFEGKQIHIVMYHSHDPDNMSGWGGGSCLWEPTESCPFDHHIYPSKLLHFDETGVFQKELSLKTLDGVKKLPLSALPGHRAQVVVCSFGDLSVGDMDMDSLRDRASGLVDQLNLVQDLLKKRGV